MAICVPLRISVQSVIASRNGHVNRANEEYFSSNMNSVGSTVVNHFDIFVS